MYDVLYRDNANQCTVLASRLGREAAVEVARDEARRRGVARMFLRGSASVPRGEAILIIRTGP